MPHRLANQCRWYSQHSSCLRTMKHLSCTKAHISYIYITRKRSNFHFLFFYFFQSETFTATTQKEMYL
ncbi:hypothetical protein EUGRSUZ_K00206 [Eucalyptus grandis]|uniref:Uncharacterized protein n=2 Tax=Eucalyptus grandis TaxID=71139 RepID=A0ACC3IPS4_EUCGR|nr:hypothetical protein EUGRSUZ_K00206 [Eucalyptus grandis]